MHLLVTLHILPQANPSLWFMSTLRIHTLEQSLCLGDSHQWIHPVMGSECNYIRSLPGDISVNIKARTKIPKHRYTVLETGDIVMVFYNAIWIWIGVFILVRTNNCRGPIENVSYSTRLFIFHTIGLSLWSRTYGYLWLWELYLIVLDKIRFITMIKCFG